MAKAGRPIKFGIRLTPEPQFWISGLMGIPKLGAT